MISNRSSINCLYIHIDQLLCLRRRLQLKQKLGIPTGRDDPDL